MEDQADIDRLLDQIEKTTQPGSMIIRPTTTTADDFEELSELIDDIRSATDLSVDTAEQKSTGSQRRRPVIEDEQCEASSSHDLQQRCFPTYLGGSSVDVGLNSTTSTCSLCCANLRCVDCDFSVIRQQDYVWHSSTDYLFLRNHMPDVAKLRAQLIPKAGCCAYACQCSWRNVEQLADVKSDPTLKWICGKH